MRKIFLILFLIVFSLGTFYFLWLYPKYTVPILIYHAVDYQEGSFFVSPENFSKQMEYIKQRGYKVITLDELVKNIQNKKNFKRNEVVITFDDGYQDSFKYAYPVLVKFNFPATVFLITDYLGKENRFLNWDEVRIMSKNNISFGGHTKNHFYLGIVENNKVAQEQIAGSK